MANSITKVRSNYFHVKDEEKFRSFMEQVYGDGDVEVYEENHTFAFACNGDISGLRNAACDEDDDADETAYDEFINGLQDLVAENDAVIIWSIGYEKLCYLHGSVEIITAKEGWTYTDLDSVAIGIAREKLKNPMWTTRNAY